MMKTPWFEKDVVQIGDDLAVGAANKTTDILVVGLQPEPNKSGPFAGVLLYYAITQTGGSTNSDITINTFLSYDGVTLDSEVAIQWTTTGAVSGKTHDYTRMLLAAEPNIFSNTNHGPPIGAAFRQTISRADGDRNLVVDVYARRFWWR